MGIDITGPIKDNKKLFLSMGALIILALFMSVAASTDSGFFGFWSGGASNVIDDNSSNNDGNSNGIAKPVSNGKNAKYFAQPAMELKSAVDYQAVVKTSMGNITIDLFEDQTPKTVNNFVFLAKDNFYDGSSFHRVIEDFVIQGGDPLGTGLGGPGYRFEDEIVSGLDFEPFVVAMANGGEDTNGSQFFITTRNSNTTTLNGGYTIFGQVVDGFSVVDKIEKVDVDSRSYDHMPIDSIRIMDVSILEK